MPNRVTKSSIHHCLEGPCVFTDGVRHSQILLNSDSGLIDYVGPPIYSAKEVDQTFDTNHLIFAGMGDVHIHAREDVTAKNCYKEDFVSATCAAVAGGLTHVCDMPNNLKAPIDDHSYAKKLELAQKGKINITLYAGIGPGTCPLSNRVPYKVYMGPSVGDLYFKSNRDLDTVLKQYQGQWVSFHCEDPDILKKNKAKKIHSERRPLEAEVMATKTALALIEKYHLKGKLCHYSSGQGLETIRQFRNKGGSVQIEVTPQHLYFGVDDPGMTAEQIHFLQMNPPIRNRVESEALLNALKLGEIDYLATDHAPHTWEEKRVGASGLTGLDTYGAFVTWLIVEKNVSPSIIAKICCSNPGQFISHFKAGQSSPLESRGVGELSFGYEGNLTVLNLNLPTLIKKEDLKTKVNWSPFEGHQFPGRAVQVFYRGRKVK